MTISSTSRKAGPFIGNGSASTFAFSFRVFQASDLEVVQSSTATGVETTLVMNSGYTVSLNADQNGNPGGSITLVGGALASGYSLIITSNIANLQPTDLTNQGGFYPEVITDALDRATIQIQQLDEHAGRTLAYPITDPSIGTELPAVAQRANKFLAFDENGAPVADLPSTVAGWENYQSAAAASASAASASATTAAGSASEATSQATAATTQAGIATTQAGISTAQATIATTQATAAGVAKAAAETARDAAYSNANVYADTAAGLAATTNGQQFSVVSGSELIRYTNSAGTAVEVSRMPNSTGLQNAVIFSGDLNNYGSLKSRNLYEPGNYVTGQLIVAATGAESANAGYSSTGYIPVIAGKQFIMNAAGLGSAPYGYAYYDYKKTFISGGTTAIAANTPTTAPSNAAYIRMSWSGTTGPDVKTFMFMLGSTLPTVFKSAEYFDALQSNAKIVQGVRTYLGIVNLMDPSATTDNTIITDGVTSALSGYWTTDFMPVEAGSKVISNTTQSGLTGNRSFNFFDKDKNFLSALSSPHSANTAYDVPAAACWVRTCYPNTTSKATVMIVQGATVPAAYIPYGLPNASVISTRARNLDLAARPSSVLNLYEKALRTPDYLINAGNGSLVSYAGYTSTGYMPVTPSGTITIGIASASLAAPYGVAFYDVDKVYISGVTAPFTANQAISVPATAYYARACFFSTQVDTFIVLEGTKTAGHIATHTLAVLSDTRPWTNRKFAILGDSISANTNWMATATSQMQASVGLFAAVAGRQMVNALKTTGGVDLTASDFTNIDAALLFLGTNDSGTTLGAITDATSASTFYGQTKKAVETLLGWKSTLSVVVATLLQRADQDVTARSQALRDVANFYAVPILDFNRWSGINTLNTSTYYYDTVHPNALGYSACVVPTAVGFFETLRPRS